ncbi:MAG TPA: type II toxin-antitoxin system VapB family antitoxin [Tetrasphaera sp.]|nr:type II toxin-antitoxin system VapB family antitoxin [Tetrasphaera sp.]HNQ08285.1 type II toxin-antitoxin system VapB family antitoxin [Tetrasphaera sp.]
MTITIKNDEVERKVRELALRTGQTLTGAIASAVARELAATPRTHETRQER